MNSMFRESEIGLVETPDRQQLAAPGAKPKSAAPAAAPHPALPERDRAKTRAKTTNTSPGLAVTQTPRGKAKAAKPKLSWPKPKSDELSPVGSVALLVSEIVDLQKTRRFCIRSQSRCDRSIEALIASHLGYEGEKTPPKLRLEMFKMSANIRKAVEKAHTRGLVRSSKGSGVDLAEEWTRAIGAIIEGAPPPRLERMLGLIPASAESRKIWDDKRKDTETSMIELADQLPISAWARSIPGFGLLNLAIIIGEAGLPVGDYRSVAGLWKRCGLAVFDGERQRKMTGKTSGTEQKYNPGRRAEVYVVGSVSVFLAQKEGMKYREIYLRRRQHTHPRIELTKDLSAKDPEKWSLGRSDNDARRIMTKSLLKDLWVEWRRLEKSPINPSEL